MDTLKKEAIKIFEDKYQSFQLCERVCKGDFDRLKAFISDLVDQLAEEKDKEFRKLVEKDREMYFNTADIDKIDMVVAIRNKLKREILDDLSLSTENTK